MAEHLSDASYFEQPGDHLLWLGDTDAMFTARPGEILVSRTVSDLVAGSEIAFADRGASP